jgi:hypothetical protein
MEKPMNIRFTIAAVFMCNLFFLPHAHAERLVSAERSRELGSGVSRRSGGRASIHAAADHRVCNFGIEVVGWHTRTCRLKLRGKLCNLNYRGEIGGIVGGKS